MYKTYNFEKREDIQHFDNEINILSHIRKFGIQGINLASCFDIYSKLDPKVVYMAIDFKTHLFHLFTMIRNLNHNMYRDDTETLFTFHGNWISFVALYRSFFDKFMNILIYTCFNDRYRDFDKSKSKNRSFKKILTGNNTIYTSTGIFMELPDDFIEWSHDYLDKINRQYRTAEVHGDGSARKWVFQEPDINKTPLALVNELINHMDQFLRITCFILMGKDFGEELSKGIYEEKY